MEMSISNRDGTCHLLRDGKPFFTPKKQPVVLSPQALAEAVAAEWAGGQPFSPRRMPLTSIAYTAIDVIGAHRESMESAMLAFAETDLLCYHSETPALRERQQKHWQPVVEWAGGQFGDISVTDGVMPVDQPKKTLDRFRAAIKKMDDFTLAAFSVMVQNLGSLLLAFAVKEGRLSVEEAFHCSRIDEDFQAEQWGEDSVTLGRAREIEKEVQAAARFLALI